MQSQNIKLTSKKALFTSMASVALLGSATTAVAAMITATPVHAEATTKDVKANDASKEISGSLDFPIIKDGVETTIKLAFNGVPDDQNGLLTVFAPQIPGYTILDNGTIKPGWGVGIDVNGKIQIFTADVVEYVKNDDTGNSNNGSDNSSKEFSGYYDFPFIKDGVQSTIRMKYSGNPGLVEIIAPEYDGYTKDPNHDQDWIGQIDDNGVFTFIGVPVRYIKTSDAGNGNGNNNGSDNSSNSSSSSDQPGKETPSDDKGQKPTKDNQDGTTSQSGKDATNKTPKPTANNQAKKPTTLLQTGVNHPAVTIATIASAVIAVLSGAFGFIKRF